jgi:hypothetical protein
MADIRPGQEFASWNSIPSSDVGQAVKTGLMAYGMQKTGLTDWLNNLNKPSEQQTVVQGAVPLPASFDKYLAPTQPGQAVVPPSAQPIGAAPVAPVAPTIESAPAPTQNPKEMGLDWLNGKLSGFTNPQASRDIQVAQQMSAPQSPMNPAEWQSVSTGEGKLGMVMKMLGAVG